MADGARFDAMEITQVVDAMSKAVAVAPAEAMAIVGKGALNIKQDAARRASGHPRFKRLPAAIDYDLYPSLKGPSAEIGPNHNKPQGNLGHILENGAPHTAPRPYMAPAGEAEEPKFAAAIEAAMVKALGL